MADREHLDILGRGAWIWNDWREKNPDVTPDLRGAYLREFNLSRFNLRKADLRKAMLMAANLSYADLRGADLSFADLRFAVFQRPEVRGASFREARGVTEGILKAAQGPSKKNKQLRAAAFALCALLALGSLWVLSDSILIALRPHLPGAITAWLERQERADEPAEDQATTASDVSGGDEARVLDGPAAVEASITELRWPGWDLTRVEVAVARIKVRVNRDRVSEDVLIPTVAGICGAVLSSKEPPPSDEILVLNETGEEGWSYQTPEQCAELLRAPLTMMRLAIAGNSRPIRFTPGMD